MKSYNYLGGGNYKCLGGFSKLAQGQSYLLLAKYCLTVIISLMTSLLLSTQVKSGNRYQEYALLNLYYNSKLI